MMFDKDRKCPKCGTPDAGVKYCDGSLVPWNSSCKRGDVANEHFHRACKTCGFEWLENIQPQAS
jgi:hypothetical protein